MITKKKKTVDFNDEIFDSNDEDEIGSDELLSDDSLRLPAGANILVRVHAVRAWLSRRRAEAVHAVGDAALVLQEAMQRSQQQQELQRLRRRERREQQQQLQHTQQQLHVTQAQLLAYEEAQALLEECIAHGSGERVLVEYYLELEDLVQRIIQSIPSQPLESLAELNAPGERDTGEEQNTQARLQALADVQRRVENIVALNADED